jgi:hypothetical protein
MLIVCGVCYLLMFGVEYSKVVRTQNWPTVDAEVIDAINGIPLTKFNQIRHELSIIVNWSYIKYSYKVGDGYYEEVKDLGPKVSVIDWIIGPMKERFPPKKIIQIHYNPNNPKDTAVGFDVFQPFPTLCGSSFILLVLGGVSLYFNSIVMGTAGGDDEELNKPLSYFAEKAKKERLDRDQMTR